MADAVVEIQDDELKALCARLNKIALKPGERKDLLGRIGAEIETQTTERFATKETPDGDSWTDIAESTKNHYLKRFGSKNPGNGILWREGSLMNSITHEVNSWSVVVGATKVYAAVHHFGWKDRNIPARPYLGLSDEDKTDIIAIINGFLSEIGK